MVGGQPIQGSRSLCRRGRESFRALERTAVHRRARSASEALRPASDLPGPRSLPPLLYGPTRGGGVRGSLALACEPGLYPRPVTEPARFELALPRTLEHYAGRSRTSEARMEIFTLSGDELLFRNAEELERVLGELDSSVPGRTEGRRSHHRERYCVTRYLSTLSNSSLLSFPLKVLKS